MGVSRSVLRFFDDQRFSFAKRSLESELASLIGLMEGHKNADVPAGHLYYSLLKQRADLAIATYQATAKKLALPIPSRDDVVLGVPTLIELDRLASGTEKQGAVAAIVPAVTGALVVGGAFITIYAAVCHNVYVYLTHWAWLYR